MLGQIKPSFINGTPVADLAALTGKSWLHAFSWPSLEPTTVDTRGFLFRSPESLSRWRHPASLDCMPSDRKRRTRIQSVERNNFQVYPKTGSTAPKRKSHQEALRARNGRRSEFFNHHAPASDPGLKHVISPA